MDWGEPQFWSEETKQFFYYYIDIIYETNPTTQEERVVAIVIDDSKRAYETMRSIHGTWKPRRHTIWCETPDWFHIC
jgi:hypothetical protein